MYVYLHTLSHTHLYTTDAIGFVIHGQYTKNTSSNAYRYYHLITYYPIHTTVLQIPSDLFNIGTILRTLYLTYTFIIHYHACIPHHFRYR